MQLGCMAAAAQQRAGAALDELLRLACRAHRVAIALRA
jgi:hypothetical protein